MATMTTTTKTTEREWRTQVEAVAEAGDKLAKELRQLRVLWADRGGKREDACPLLWQMFSGSADIHAGDGSASIRSRGTWELAVREWRLRGWLPPEDVAA